MKAAVVTFHNAMNYGATLQTWALQKAIKNLGADPCVINYHTDAIDRLYLPAKADTFEKKKKKLFDAEYRNNLKDQELKYDKYHAFLNKHLDIVGDYTSYEALATDAKNELSGIDAFITGSDQVWNTDHTGGYDGAYTLDFVKSGKKISYAASIGRDFFLPQYSEQFSNALKSFDAISVRENEGVAAVGGVCDKRAEVVLDPTLLLKAKDYDEIYTEKKRPYRYILVYMMETNKSFISLANSLSSTTGLPIIQRRQKHFFKNEIDSFYTDTPGEFLSEIKNAEMVLTNSFHGTVFSIMYRKPFISMLHTQTGSRVVDLLTGLGLDEHIIYRQSDFATMDQLKIKDEAALSARIDELSGKSREFLKKSLGV